MSLIPFPVAALSSYDARHLNLAAVLEEIRERPGQSRSEIGAMMPFSRQTMTNVVQELLDMGLVRESERLDRRRGNPHRSLSVCAEAGYAVGARLRWTSCTLTLTGLDQQSVDVADVGIDVEQGDMEGYLRAFSGIAHAFLARHADKDVWGLGLAGPLSIATPGSAVRYGSDATGLDDGWFRETPFKRHLEAELGLPVSVINNPHAAALAQSSVAPGNARFVYLLLGMGLGASFVTDRSISRDIWPHGGELGHILYEERPLNAVLSAVALGRWLGLDAPPMTLEGQIEDALAANPDHAERWLDVASPVLRFIVNFLEAAIWPDGIALGGFLPDWYLARLVERAAPLNKSVVLPEGDPRRQMRRLAVGTRGRDDIPFGAALSILSYRQNRDLPQILASRRLQRRPR
jgi:predicted NBD/HSP70 family sugar kinase